MYVFALQHTKGATLHSNTYSREDILMCHPSKQPPQYWHWTAVLVLAVMVLAAVRYGATVWRRRATAWTLLPTSATT